MRNAASKPTAMRPTTASATNVRRLAYWKLYDS
jgi:hypothetical protein